MKRKIFVNFAIILILWGVCFNGYFMGSGLSSDSSFNVYAEVNNGGSDEWQNSDLSMQAQAFIAYCKSNNLAISGSVLDALTSFTTDTYNKICNTLGINPTELQADIKYTTQGNLGLRFLFTQTGATAMNRVFAEFLQNNDLSVGDTVEDKELFNGKSYIDQDGRYALIYVVKSNTSSTNLSDIFSQIGTTYRWYDSDFDAMLQNSSGWISSTYYIDTVSYYFEKYESSLYGRPLNGTVDRTNNSSGDFFSNCIIVKDGKYLRLSALRQNKKTGVYSLSGIVNIYSDASNVGTDTNVVANTVNNTNITNNNYTNNNYTIINNNGDTYYYDTEPDPDTPLNPDPTPDPPNPPPVEPTPDIPPVVPDWDIELPEMPTGNDWLLYGLEKKFPWDIPFNLMYMLSIFAADPETPHFVGTLDFKIFQWNYDIDLAPFDEIAGYVREFEFIAFLIGLMLLTRRLIWG